MSAQLTQKGRQYAWKLCYWQLLTLGIIILFTLLLHRENVIAIATGSLIHILPTQVFALFAFKYGGATKSQLVLKSFNQGLKVKMGMSIVLFVFAMQFVAPAELVLLGFASTLLSHLLGQVVLSK